MVTVSTETIRFEKFVQGLNILLVEPRLPVAVKEKLYDNQVIMDGPISEDGRVVLHELDRKALLPYMSVAVLLAIKPILKGV